MDPISNIAASIPDRLRAPTTSDEQDKDLRSQFMTLLMAQFRHQDPMSPADGTAFISQLATLGQVEQAAETNQTLGMLVARQETSNRMGLVSMIGRTIDAKASEFDAPVPGDAQFLADVPANATDLKLSIVDSSGKVVRERALKANGKGELPIEINADGEAALGGGHYTIKITATVDGKPDTAVSTAIRGVMTRLDLAANPPVFFIGNTRLSTGDITAIRE